MEEEREEGMSSSIRIMNSNAVYAVGSGDEESNDEEDNREGEGNRIQKVVQASERRMKVMEVCALFM